MREAANILWAVASFETIDESGDCFANTWRGICNLNVQGAHSTDHRDFLQIHQALLARRDIVQSHNLVEIEGAAELFEEAAETWGHMLATEFRSSTYAEDVDNALQSLGYLLVREDTFSGLAVDFMLYLEGGNVEVEVYGPSHLNRTTLGPNGRTRLKQRMLRSMGYTLLCVPYHHWDLLRSPQAQTAYLEERLVGVMSGTDDGTAIDADAGAWDDVGARLLGEELAARPGGPMAGAGGGRTLPAAVANARERARQQGGGRKPRDGWVDIDL